MFVDSTGKGPSGVDIALSAGEEIDLRLDSPASPSSLEARLYAGRGLAGSFLQWPEALPLGAELLEQAELAPSLGSTYAPQAPAGSYSLVVRAIWDNDIDVFFAIGLTIE